MADKFKLIIEDTPENRKAILDAINQMDEFKPRYVYVGNPMALYMEYGTAPAAKKTRAKGEVFNRFVTWAHAKGDKIKKRKVYRVYKDIMMNGMRHRPFFRTAVFEMMDKLSKGNHGYNSLQEVADALMSDINSHFLDEMSKRPNFFGLPLMNLDLGCEVLTDPNNIPNMDTGPKSTALLQKSRLGYYPGNDREPRMTWAEICMVSKARRRHP